MVLNGHAILFSLNDGGKNGRKKFEEGEKNKKSIFFFKLFEIKKKVKTLSFVDLLKSL